MRLREKSGKLNEMPCHHNLETYLHEYLQAAALADEKSSPLFRKVSFEPRRRSCRIRKAQREAREREAAAQAQREAELENWRREQQAILDDPNSSEEDKKWARKMVTAEESS